MKTCPPQGKPTDFFEYGLKNASGGPKQQVTELNFAPEN